ncbi:hypothetical protein JHK84_030880 [Glycine max]|nr:hypothetical protein JHK84_030880 [Glycine max]
MEKKNSDGEAFPRPRRVERTFPSPHARGSPHLHRVAWHSLFAQATGIDAVVLHSPRIFEKAGIKSDNYLLLRDGCGWTLAFDSGPEPHSGGPFADHADVGGWAQHRCVAAWIFHYTLLPEISGKTLEEIEKSFGNFFGKPKEEAEGVVDYNGEIQLKTCDQTLTSVD